MRAVKQNRPKPPQYWRVQTNTVELDAWAVYVPYNLTWSYEEIDPAQDVRHRYVEAEHLGRIPELIEELAKRSVL